MKNLPEIVGLVITIPFLLIEVILKVIMRILYYPTVLSMAIIYPLISKRNLEWIDKWNNYCTKWKGGFYCGFIYKLWEVKK